MTAGLFIHLRGAEVISYNRTLSPAVVFYFRRISDEELTSPSTAPKDGFRGRSSPTRESFPPIPRSSRDSPRPTPLRKFPYVTDPARGRGKTNSSTFDVLSSPLQSRRRRSLVSPVAARCYRERAGITYAQVKNSMVSRTLAFNLRGKPEELK
jgi:hypothetical protein